MDPVRRVTNGDRNHLEVKTDQLKTVIRITKHLPASLPSLYENHKHKNQPTTKSV